MAFHYPGEDGKFGKTYANLRDKDSVSLDEKIGLDRSGDGKDDIVSDRLVVPVNRKVFIELFSIDVLHSFFLPNFRVKQDAVPGLKLRVWLEAGKTSKQVIGRDPKNVMEVYNQTSETYVKITDSKPFDIVCAELCGQGHSTMRGMLFVVQQDEYELFLEQSKPAEDASFEFE